MQHMVIVTCGSSLTRLVLMRLVSRARGTSPETLRCGAECGCGTYMGLREKVAQGNFPKIDSDLYLCLEANVRHCVIKPTFQPHFEDISENGTSKYVVTIDPMKTRGILYIEGGNRRLQI